MRDVATPMLYQDMVVYVDKLNSEFLQVITAKDHRGLPHVRTLLVVGRPWEERMYYHGYEIIFNLLYAIPRDLLTRFE